MNVPQSRSRALTAFVLLVFTVLLIAAPLAFVFAQSFQNDNGFSLDAYRTVLTASRQWTLLCRSLVVAASVTALATLLGAAAAFALSRVRAASCWLFVLSLPLLIPQHIMAIAWVDILGRSGYAAQFVRIALPGAPPAPSPFTVLGTIFILSITIYPIAMIATSIGLHRIDERLVEIARVSGQHTRAFRNVVLPLVMPATLSAACLTFAITLSTFSVPSLLQVNTYPVEIHASSTTFDYGAAAAQSLPLIALCALLFAAWRRYVQPRHAWLAGARRADSTRITNSRRAQLAVLLLALVAWALPMLALFFRALPLRNFFAVWETAHDEIVTGLLLAFCTATLLTPFAFVLAFTARRTPVSRLIRMLGILGFVTPGPLLALGMISLWNRPGIFGAVYDSVAILVLAASARFFAIADNVSVSAIARMNPRLEESAAVAGVPWWRVLSGIAAPLSMPYLAAIWTIVFIFTLGEVDASVMLCPPGESTFAVRLFSLMHYGPDAFVAALSLFTALAITVAAAVALLVLRRFASRGARLA